jgi:hypothetical protein
VDAAIISAPSSTKNKDKARDPAHASEIVRLTLWVRDINQRSSPDREAHKIPSIVACEEVDLLAVSLSCRCAAIVVSIRALGRLCGGSR